MKVEKNKSKNLIAVVYIYNESSINVLTTEKILPPGPIISPLSRTLTPSKPMSCCILAECSPTGEEGQDCLQGGHFHLHKWMAIHCKKVKHPRALLSKK